MKPEQVNAGAPAFASSEAWRAGNMGLTKREYIAATIMAGMLVNGFMPTRYGKAGMADGTWSYEAAAVQAADALLLELAQS